MNKYCVTAPENIPDMTLQSYLAHAMPLLSFGALREAFQKKDVKMNGVRTSREARVLPGAEITVFTPFEIKIPVVYEDEDVLVLHKPAGVSTDTDKYNSMTVLDWAVIYAGGAYEPRMCHRLDNATSGLIALAKNEKAENALKEMFHARTGEKEYRCLVGGVPYPYYGVIKAYLTKDPVHGYVHVSDRETEGAKEIITEYETLHYANEVSLLKVLLHTGRTHQIRAHMRHIGHPILGDDLYGSRELNRKHAAGRLMLCAVRLKFDTQGKLPQIDGLEVKIRAPFE